MLELSLMKNDGEVMTLTCHDEDKDTFHAATLSLGALGIIISVKLQCEPAFRLQQVSYAATLQDASIPLVYSRICHWQSKEVNWH